MIDHLGGNTLHHQKSNLRICTQAQNCSKQKSSKLNTSGYKGVVYNKKNKRYYARITVNRIIFSLGGYIYIKDAARAYNAAAIKYHGEFAKLNKID